MCTVFSTALARELDDYPCNSIDDCYAEESCVDIFDDGQKFCIKLVNRKHPVIKSEAVKIKGKLFIWTSNLVLNFPLASQKRILAFLLPFLLNSGKSACLPVKTRSKGLSGWCLGMILLVSKIIISTKRDYVGFNNIHHYLA